MARRLSTFVDITNIAAPSIEARLLGMLECPHAACHARRHAAVMPACFSHQVPRRMAYH